MKKSFITLILFFCFWITAHSQEMIRLYENKAPGSEDCNYEEIEYPNAGSGKKMIRNVVDPTLEVYLPEKSLSTGIAVIVCPGGGNVWLSYQSEGTEVAEWLAKKGVAAFVLKYRLNKTPESEEGFNEFVASFFARMTTQITSESTADEETQTSEQTSLNTPNYAGDDGIKAVEYVREHASEYGIDPNKVGIIGFSAGAALTMNVISNSSPNNQPNFAGPIYGGSLNGHEVPENAPPLFILGAADDPIAAGGIDLYTSWREKGLSAELHMYSQGGHGFGMDQQGLPVDSWIDRFWDWLNVNINKK